MDIDVRDHWCWMLVFTACLVSLLGITHILRFIVEAWPLMNFYIAAENYCWSGEQTYGACRV